MLSWKKQKRRVLFRSWKKQWGGKQLGESVFQVIFINNGEPSHRFCKSFEIYWSAYTFTMPLLQLFWETLAFRGTCSYIGALGHPQQAVTDPDYQQKFHFRCRPYTLFKTEWYRINIGVQAELALDPQPVCNKCNITNTLSVCRLYVWHSAQRLVQSRNTTGAGETGDRAGASECSCPPESHPVLEPLCEQITWVTQMWFLPFKLVTIFLEVKKQRPPGINRFNLDDSLGWSHCKQFLFCGSRWLARPSRLPR